MRIRALSLLALLLLAGPVSAHDKWIEAEPFFRAAPGPVKLYLVTGESLRDAELLPLRRRAAVSRFQMHRSTGQHDLAAALREDQQPVAVVEPGQVPVGTSVVLLDMAPVDIELPAEKFESYLFSERLFDVLVLRAKMRQEEAPGRERYTRSLKAILQVGDRLDTVAQRPLGQELEIVPQQHPSGAPSTLFVQVLFRGKPLGGRALTCANRRHGAIVTRTVRTNGNGMASCALGQGGEWMLSLVHMEPSREPGADWRSFWTSLTFALPETAKR